MHRSASMHDGRMLQSCTLCIANTYTQPHLFPYTVYPLTTTHYHERDCSPIHCYSCCRGHPGSSSSCVYRSIHRQCSYKRRTRPDRDTTCEQDNSSWIEGRQQQGQGHCFYQALRHRAGQTLHSRIGKQRRAIKDGVEQAKEERQEGCHSIRCSSC